MTIAEWANEGLEIAERSGKTVDDLAEFLKYADSLKNLFRCVSENKTNEADQHNNRFRLLFNKV